MITINVDEKLGLNKFFVDENNAHIELTEQMDLAEFKKLQIACPAALYDIDESGKIKFDYAGCLECGTCRILCSDTIIKKWEYPLGGFGVEYRHG